RRVPPARAPSRCGGSALVNSGITGWLAARSGRERALLTLAAATTAGGLVLGIALALRADLSAREASVAARERELATVRRLAAAPGAGPGGAPAGGPARGGAAPRAGRERRRRASTQRRHDTHHGTASRGPARGTRRGAPQRHIARRGGPPAARSRERRSPAAG